MPDARYCSATQFTERSNGAYAVPPISTKRGQVRESRNGRQGLNGWTRPYCVVVALDLLVGLAVAVDVVRRQQRGIDAAVDAGLAVVHVRTPRSG